MPERSVNHSTFTIKRTYKRPPAKVFFAWADQATKARWFGGGGDDSGSSYELDFRVGGRETNHSKPGSSFAFAFDGYYHEIVPNERIVFSYDLALGGPLVSVSLVTVEFKAAGGGTQLTYTEHGAYLDSLDSPALRKQGTRGLLTALGKEVEHMAGKA